MRRIESSLRSTTHPKKEPGGERFEVTRVASGGTSEVLNTKAVAFETVRG